MNSLVKWGHWIVAACFAVAACLAFPPVFRLLVAHKQTAFSELALGLGLGMFRLALLASIAWGIVRWRNWGHALALTLVGCDLVINSLPLVFFGRHALTGGMVVAIFFPCFFIAWLLLPSVRSAYWASEGFA